MKPLPAIMVLVCIALLAILGRIGSAQATSQRRVEPVEIFNPIIEVGTHYETNFQRRILTPQYDGPPFPGIEGTQMVVRTTVSKFTTFPFQYRGQWIVPRITNSVTSEEHWTRPTAKDKWTIKK